MSLEAPEGIPLEADYAAIESAVMETERGRWFLAEYANRHRSADTTSVLAAIGRLEMLAGLAPASVGDNRLTDIAALVAESRTGDGTARAERPGRNAANAIAAVRNIADKIHAIATGMRDRTDTANQTDALALHCADLAAAADLADAACRRLAALAGVVDLVDAIVSRPIAVEADEPKVVEEPAVPMDASPLTRQAMTTPSVVRERPALFFVRSAG